jgi:uncharacterized paraquat-inducible protein A
MENFEDTDQLTDDEYPDEVEGSDDWCDDDPSQTHPCPICNAEVYEDAEQCPICGNYITHNYSPRGLWWWTALVLLLLVCLIVFLTGRL